MAFMSLRSSLLRGLVPPGTIPAGAVLLALMCGLPCPAGADPKPKAEGNAKPKVESAPRVRFDSIGLPRYTPPPSFREDLVVTTEGKDITMRRFVDQGKIRTEIKAEGRDMVMLETGDSKGTMYTLMPEEKRAMKYSRQAMAEASAKMAKGKEDDPAKTEDPSPSDLEVEDLGEETLDGTATRKLRMGKEGDVLGWFDKKTGAPLKLETEVEGKKSILEWKNRKAEPQPAELFAVPKGYEVTDMDEMMAKMGSMGAMGGVGGMAKGMAGGMVQGMGANLGESLGTTVGASLGGPLGAVAGRFIGGKIGGMLGKKAASAIN